MTIPRMIAYQHRHNSLDSVGPDVVDHDLSQDAVSNRTSGHICLLERPRLVHREHIHIRLPEIGIVSGRAGALVQDDNDPQ